MQIKWPQWMLSSAGNGNLSLTIRGLFVALVPALIAVLRLRGVVVTEADVITAFDTILTGVSGLMVFVGLGRKAFYSLSS